MAAADKNGKWWSRDFGIDHHSYHGVFHGKLLVKCDISMVVCGLKETGNMSIIFKNKMGQDTTVFIPT